MVAKFDLWGFCKYNLPDDEQSVGVHTLVHLLISEKRGKLVLGSTAKEQCLYWE